MSGEYLSFRASSELRMHLKILQDFYAVTTTNRLLPSLIVMAVTDVSLLPENSDWSPEQKKAWQYCLSITAELKKVITTHSAKTILDAKASKIAHDTACRILSESLPREFLVAVAEELGIACTGKRKSGIIRLIKEKRND